MRRLVLNSAYNRFNVALTEDGSNNETEIEDLYQEYLAEVKANKH